MQILIYYSIIVALAIYTTYIYNTYNYCNTRSSTSTPSPLHICTSLLMIIPILCTFVRMYSVHGGWDMYTQIIIKTHKQEISPFYITSGNSSTGCTGDTKTIQIQRVVIGVLAGLLLILGLLGIATAFKLYKKYLYERCLKALTCAYCREHGNCCQCPNDEMRPLINQEN